MLKYPFPRHVVMSFAIAGVWLGASSIAGNAKSTGPFSTLTGAWAGTGQARLEGGRTEAMKCKAYYTDRSGGSGLGISLRCAGAASSNIDLKATLSASGSRVSGSWEERQYNTGGSVTGQVNGNRISVAIDGGGLNGTMTVTTNGRSQSVQISAEGVAFRGMSIAMSRTD
jgi:hypothetical protein